MAIKTDINASQFGVPFAGAYFRIITASIMRQHSDDSKFRVMVDVAGYATETPSEGTREVQARRYHALLDDIEAQDGDTFLARCYAWVMLQPDMQGSTAI
jgi:hypothetical protein